MNILQINAVGQASSTGRTCRELAAYINEKTPHSCYTAFAQGTENEYAFQLGGKIGWKLHGLLSRISGKQAHFSSFSTRKLLKKMHQIRPDMVILRNLHGNYIHFPMLMRYLAKHNIATIVVLHDCWVFTGKCCHYTVAGCDRWKTGCHHCPQLKTDNVSWFFDRTSALWKEKKRLFEAVPRLAVVGVSEWTKEQGESSFLSCADCIERIYNWIDLDVFYPRENGEELKEKLRIIDKKVVLGVASGWSNAKGLDKFCHLAESLGDEYAVVLVGQMQDAYQLPSNVITVPPTASADVLAEYYSMADIFVSLSLQETFGKVSAEALACGTPIVCFDSTANKEMVGDGYGKAVAPNDINGIIDAVEKICQKDKQEYINRCRQFAATHFDKEKNIVSYLQLFEKLTADKE